MKDYKAKVIKVIDESSSVKCFTLDIAFDFIPGQYIMISIPGFVNEEGTVIKRSFSIASAPNDPIELCIAKTGVFSSKMFSISEDQELDILGPMGKFVLNFPIADGTNFIALGTGIAPLISMIRFLKEEEPDKKFNLLFGIRSEKDYLYRQELESCENLNLFTCISSGDSGRVTEHLDKLNNSKDVYICGNPDAVDEIRDKLVSLGFSNDRIFREKW